MKRASDEWQSPQFHHRKPQTHRRKKNNRAKLDKLLRLFQNCQCSHTYYSNEPIEAERAVPEERTCSEPAKKAAIHLPEGIEKQLKFQFKIEIESSLAIPGNNY